MSTVQSSAQQASELFMRQAFARNKLPFLLAGKMDSVYKAEDLRQGTSSAGAPVVYCNDLQQRSGTSVAVKLIHALAERGVTGDGGGHGTEEEQSSSDQIVPVKNHEHSVITQLDDAAQANPVQMKLLHKPQLLEHFAWRMEQTMIWLAYGQRGYANGRRYLVPPESDPSSAAIAADEFIYPLQSPTWRAKLYAGNATSISGAGGTTAIAATDVLKLSDLSKFAEANMEHPMDNATYASEDGAAKKVMPASIGFIGSKGWLSLKADIKAQGLDEIVSNATRELMDSWGQNFLFRDGAFLYEDTLWRPISTACRFPAGSSVMVSADANDPAPAAQTVPAGVNVERCFVLYANAITFAFGRQSNGFYNFIYDSTVNKETEHGKSFSSWYKSCYGGVKSQHRDQSGRLEDIGVRCMDYAVPA